MRLRDNLDKGGKPVMDCIFSELKEVEDHLLIHYVSESIQKQDIHSLYESFYKQEEIFFGMEVRDLDKNDTYLTECEDLDDTLLHRHTIGGQKEKQKEYEKEKQQKAVHPNIENNPDIENPLHQKTEDYKEIVELLDANGFGFTNVNAKQQLLSWLGDSSFLQPK